MEQLLPAVIPTPFSQTDLHIIIAVTACGVHLNFSPLVATNITDV